jgi:hypothetical protein
MPHVARRHGHLNISSMLDNSMCKDRDGVVVVAASHEFLLWWRFGSHILFGAD